MTQVPTNLAPSTEVHVGGTAGLRLLRSRTVLFFIVYSMILSSTLRLKTYFLLFFRNIWLIEKIGLLLYSYAESRHHNVLILVQVGQRNSR